MRGVGPVLAALLAVLTAAAASAHAAAPPRIVYQSDRDNGTSDLYRIGLDGAPPGRLTDHYPGAEAAAVAPDGKTIAYSVWTGGLWLMDADGANPRELLAGYVRAPDWSPDGRTLAFHGMRPGDDGRGVYVMGLDGTGVRRVTPHVEGQSDSFPSFSPDSSQLAFECYTNICVIDADGTDKRTVSLMMGARLPAWSPDGSRIAFTAYGPPEDLGSYGNEIYTIRPDGTDLRRLTHNLEDDTAPSWSPDGRRLVFNAERDGNTELYVMNADGSNQIRLTHDPVRGPSDGAGSWDPSTGSGLEPAPDKPVGRRKARLRVRVQRRQPLDAGVIALVVRAAPGARAAVRGRLVVSKRRRGALKPAVRTVGPRGKARFALGLSARQIRVARRALRRRGTASVRLRITVVEAGAARRSATRRVRLR